MIQPLPLQYALHYKSLSTQLNIVTEHEILMQAACRRHLQAARVQAALVQELRAPHDRAAAASVPRLRSSSIFGSNSGRDSITISASQQESDQLFKGSKLSHLSAAVTLSPSLQRNRTAGVHRLLACY